jgi:hypothetical protein
LNRVPDNTQPVQKISAEARLALTLSRHRLVESHILHARELVNIGVDWDRLHSLAVKNNVVPLLASNLTAHLPEVPSETIEIFVKDRQRIRLRAMLLYTQLLFVVRSILSPKGIRFALVKGVGLSRRHYSDPFARHCQDVDLLIQPDRVWEVASELVRHGWSVGNASWAGQPVRSFARFVSVVEMVSPEGMRIELHRMLDNSGIVFDSVAVLGRAEMLEFFGSQLPVLSCLDEFLYVCYHHTRHAWSCLHWCADLPAMIARPGFAEAVLKLALRVPLMGSTVSACALLAANLDAIASGADIGRIAPRSPLLDACLRGIDQAHRPVASESSEDVSEIEPDFPFNWQRSWAYRWRFALSRCRPNLNDFDAMPLAESVQWVYWLTRPCRAVLRRLDVG